MTNPMFFRRTNKRHYYEGAPLSCWFCKAEFWTASSFTKHWCKYDLLRGHLGRGQPVTPKTRAFPPVRLHLTAADCAPPSTWWYQARAVADKVQHG